MRDADRFKLICGPYKTPRCQVGGWLRCSVCGMVQVVELSDAPILWPMTRTGTRLSPVVCGDLVHALERESAQAVGHRWGLSRRTVFKLRRALGVPKWNEGGKRLLGETVQGAPAFLSMVNHGRPPSMETRAKMSASAKARGAYPPGAGPPLTPEEIGLLGTLSDTDLAVVLGRHPNTLYKVRKRLGIPSWRTGRNA